MSRYLLECTIDADKLDVLRTLRAEHYAFLVDNRGSIVFGGPARGHEGGAPETMVIVIEAATLDDAQEFIAGEPYHRHGGFTTVRVRPWSQVIPESDPAGRRRTLEAARAARRAVTRGADPGPAPEEEPRSR